MSWTLKKLLSHPRRRRAGFAFTMQVLSFFVHTHFPPIRSRRLPSQALCTWLLSGFEPNTEKIYFFLGTRW